MNRRNYKVDRISQLPEPIIHHILSFLHTEDAVCTNILSKRWRCMWCTIPVFDFQLDEYSYLAKHGIKDCQAETSKDEFLSFVEESLNRRLLHQFSIHKFRMSMRFSNLEHLTPWMDRWLTIIIGRNVKELELEVRRCESNGLYSVPPFVLGAKSITVLKLSRLKISSQKLKQLVLKECKKSLVTEIDTPNLVSVEHTCHLRYLCFNYINTSHLREVHLEFKLASHDIGWFTKLKDFLTSFPYSENFRAVVVCSKNVSIHEKLREFFLPPLYNLKDLNPQIIISSRAFTEVLDRIFYTSHHDTLSLISTCSCSKDLELLYHTIVEQEENSEHYGGRSKNWRHFLGGFEIENLEGTKEKRTSPWRDFLKSYSSVPYQVVALRLEWKCLKIEWKASRVMF
ncbi:hypothetical protein RHMOL_Rhmol02G0018200 [Rhododendron molle]|uniref:Uncharacterized protein n=1 Tax=Rhododendron molle TaxID=49168 RepID=A0ACC0PLX9_RHOML|nr:hypothetical protein RHMOL_Rhmol02G0018200 [Rhododendron molle]